MFALIHAIIDIGSNTIRLSVFAIEGDRVRNLFNEKATTGLASYRESGKLTKEGIQRLVQTLSDYLIVIDNFEEIQETHAFATASIRNVTNADQVLARVKEDTGLDIELLSGKEEAALAFIGAVESVKDTPRGVLTDIGGGSSELVLFEEGQILDSASIDMGSLSVYKDYVEGLFMTSAERQTMDERLKFLLAAQGMERENFPLLCAVGGSARATLKLYNERYEEHPSNNRMNTDDLKALMKSLLDMENKEKMNIILKTKADRIHTFLPGMCILYRVAKYFHTEEIIVSQTGIREGYVYQRIMRRD